MTLNLDSGKRPATVARKYGQWPTLVRYLAGRPDSDKEQKQYARGVCDDAGGQAGT
jgi:hypothetical protein